MNLPPLGSPATPTSADRTGNTAAPQAGAAAKYAAVSGATSTPAPSRDEVDAAVKKLNDSMLGASQTVQFSVDHDTREIVVKVVDQNTQEVVRQMPSEEALRIARSIDDAMGKMQGRLIDHKA
jgi:flagellar protein FlaG